MQRDAERRVVLSVSIRHDGIDFGVGGDRSDMLGFQVTRAKRDPPRHAVELNERQRGGELVAGRDQHRASDELREPARSEAGSVDGMRVGSNEVAERHWKANVGGGRVRIDPNCLLDRHEARAHPNALDKLGDRKDMLPSRLSSMLNIRPVVIRSWVKLLANASAKTPSGVGREKRIVTN
jgi:hypothetical protein